MTKLHILTVQTHKVMHKGDKMTSALLTRSFLKPGLQNLKLKSIFPTGNYYCTHN